MDHHHRPCPVCGICTICDPHLHVGMTRASLALAAILIVALIAAGCSTGPTTHEMKTPDGRSLGYLTTYESSADTCGWLNGSLVHDADLKLLDHRVVAAPGLSCAVILGGAMIGSAGILGVSFPKNVGDTLSNDSSSVSGASAASSAVSNQREHYQEPKYGKRGW